MISLLTTTILAIIEGVTEFLPISSTGHLILAGKLLDVPQTVAQSTFEVFIQSGAITAVIILYSDKLRQNLTLWKKLLVGFIPAAVIGVLVIDQLDRLLDSTNVVLMSLFLGGLLFLVWDRFADRLKPKSLDLEQITYRQALLIGLAQTVAFIPGVSRSAASIFGGLIVGLEKKVAVEFSFLLAIPTIFAASAVIVVRSAGDLSMADVYTLGWGFLVALLSAWVAIRFFLNYLTKHNFALFGWYRIILAAGFALIVTRLL
jgi:undecaprenyl-diphosphatase